MKTLHLRALSENGQRAIQFIMDADDHRQDNKWTPLFQETVHQTKPYHIIISYKNPLAYRLAPPGTLANVFKGRLTTLKAIEGIDYEVKIR